MMKVLIACEESQEVCKAFRAKGHEAYSADIQEPSGGHPEWHILGDVLPIINGDCKFTAMDGTEHEIVGEWDLLIAHPPCTYLSNAGARFLYPKGVLNEDRLKQGIIAKDFFMRFYWCRAKRVAIENPVPSSVYCLPKYTQTIQPYMFGPPLKKKTCLWLKGLPNLKATSYILPDECESTRVAGNWFNQGGGDRQKNRAKTFPGIAKAMAEQWGD
jgi:hypothetical protein